MVSVLVILRIHLVLRAEGYHIFFQVPGAYQYRRNGQILVAHLKTTPDAHGFDMQIFTCMTASLRASQEPRTLNTCGSYRLVSLLIVKIPLL